MKKLMIGLLLCVGASAFGMRRGITSAIRPTSLAVRCFATKDEQENSAEQQRVLLQVLKKRQLLLEDAMRYTQTVTTFLRQAEEAYGPLSALLDPKRREAAGGLEQQVWKVYHQIRFEAQDNRWLLRNSTFLFESSKAKEEEVKKD